MTAQDVRDSFITNYKVMCLARGIKEIPLENQAGVVASWMASGQQDIVDRLNLLTKYYDINYTAVSSFTTYPLPDDYGKMLRTEPELELVDINEIPSVSTPNSPLQSGLIEKLAVYQDATGYQAAISPLPSSAGTLRVWYVVNTLFYTSDGVNSYKVYSNGTWGNIALPDKYMDLLVQYMLGVIFPEKKQEYEFNLNRMKGNSSNTRKLGFKYNLGGY